MALEFLEGFDAMATALIDERFNSVTGSPSIGATGRNGTSGLNNSSSIGVDLVLPNKATRVIGFAVRITSGALPAGRTTFVQIYEGTQAHLYLNVESTGRISIYRGSNTTLLATSTATLAVSTWYYIELKYVISDTVGELYLQVNGVADTLTFSTGSNGTQDTRQGAGGTSNIITFGGTGTTTLTFVLDDIYVLNADVADVDNPNDDFLGDIRVEVLLPSGAGTTTQFTPSAGSNYENVDDATPDSDTTYNESSTTSHKDTFALGNLVSSGPIIGLEVCNFARKTDAGSALIAPVIRSGGTDYTGNNRAPSTTYRYWTQIYDVNPDTGVAFTDSEVNALEAGYTKTG